MSKPPGCLLVFLAFASFTGCVAAGCVGAMRTSVNNSSTFYAPLPHHVAPTADAVPFRFAMVHDVIHERYDRHGDAYYLERERLARENLAVVHPDSVTAFAQTDDIAVGLDRRGRTDEAIAMLRDKLKRQLALGLAGKDLHSTYANFGEFLVHGNLWAMMGGDRTARDRVKEGSDYMRKSMEVNPSAHFGREDWQLVAVDALLLAGERPTLMQKCDLIGNRLDRDVEFIERTRPEVYRRERETDAARPYLPAWAGAIEMRGWDKTPFPNEINEETRKYARGYVTEVGGEMATQGSGDSRHGKRAPFDEPAMWLIGEWRQGSGPNPHYALCLGEIMLRVGQRYLAWNYYERAFRMAEQFSPTAEMQQFLRTHCRKRQAAIEETLPKSEVAELRLQFEKELVFGEAYQRDFQAYTEEKIKAGVKLNDEHFFDEFYASREPIASKVGPEEWYAVATEHSRMSAKIRAFWEWGIMMGGATSLVFALVLTWVYRKTPPLPQSGEGEFNSQP